MMTRPATKEDIPAIIKAIRANADDVSLAQMKDSFIEKYYTDYYVVEKEQQIVGCGGLHLYKGMAEIYSVSVPPIFKNQGVGKQLVKTFIKVSRQRKDKFIILGTAKKGYFSKFGFNKISMFTFPFTAVPFQCVKSLYMPLIHEIKKSAQSNYVLMKFKHDYSLPIKKPSEDSCACFTAPKIGLNPKYDLVYYLIKFKERELLVSMYGEDVVKNVEEELDHIHGYDHIPWYGKKWLIDEESEKQFEEDLRIYST